MLHKTQHARSGGVLHGAHPGWLIEVFCHCPPYLQAISYICNRGCTMSLQKPTKYDLDTFNPSCDQYLNL